MTEEECTFISTRKAAKLLGIQQGGLRKELRKEPDDEGNKKLDSTIFIINKKPRHFIEKKDFLKFIRKRLTKVETELETLRQAELIIEEEILNG
jgi:hypothetical protein